MTAVFPSSSFDMNLIEYPDDSAPRTRSDRFAHFLRLALSVAICAGASHRHSTVDSSPLVASRPWALLGRYVPGAQAGCFRALARTLDPICGDPHGLGVGHAVASRDADVRRLPDRSGELTSTRSNQGFRIQHL